MPTDKQRRETERRRLQRQAQRRRQQADRRRRVTLIASIVGALVVVAVIVVAIVSTSGGGSDSAAGPQTTPATTSAPSPSPSTTVSAYPCTWTKSGTASRKVSVPPTTTPSRSGTTTATVTTNRGPLTFTLDRKAAPCAVESFVSLAQQKYFDKTSCHRLTSGTLNVLQCGDPTGTGSGGPGYSFADELTGKEKYTTGVLAMANAGANTNGSQFFIVYKDSQLNPAYTVFGKVTAGLGVVDTVAKAGSTPADDGKPKLAITLTKVAVKA